MSRVALAVALLALIGTWGGPAVAAKFITGKDVADGSLTGRDVKRNSIGHRDVKDRSLRGRDFKSNSLTGRVVAGLSGRDLLPDSLDGTDIAEETLDVGRSRSAESLALAGSANGRARLARVNASLEPGESGNVLELGGLRLSASCDAGSALTLRATTTAGPARVRSSGVRATGESVYAGDDEFAPGEEFDPLAGAGGAFSGQLTYVAPDAGVVTLPLIAGPGCSVAGVATHAAG